ncbi:MAG: DUF4388 domain-containing protein [Deltaproteobacteria bacterium]|jgi:hypothetical protein|uniref:DUF4388 domain-containing protein n=1 Tax=Candidatus Acidulodesulfobacterium acidiphilum TaxID=2597224 RepID=A0A520XFZ3_9DELT|nr:DUF4388 domain-containing protein [Deltaproteobacteria bacterium]MCL6119918.1 DUF4388 domain-containing protein [Deltaproteobacteria bacterium]MDA8298406.1 DUF4388 domain-containing protein [Deltaproteobacteria bacterium]RZV40005.1 MAG: DUF4388 domain-containing protein [Candidatus Acidulodesulfobacterium acidiphilum]
MDIKGNITNLELFDVLKFLEISKKTGVLNLRFENFAAKLFIKEGKLYFLSISDNNILEKLAVKLLDMGKKDYLQILEKYRTYYKTTAGFDIYFFKSESIPKSKENEFTSSYISETLNYILFLTNGEFAFDEKPLPDIINFANPMDLSPILTECKKRRDELSVISKVIPSKNYIPSVVTNRSGNIRPLSLTPTVWNVLSLVDGKKSINQILSLTVENDFFVLKTLYNLLQSGYIKVDPPHNEHLNRQELINSVKKVLKEQLGNKAEKVPVDYNVLNSGDKQALTKTIQDIERYVYMFIDDKKAAKIDYLLKQMLMNSI